MKRVEGSNRGAHPLLAAAAGLAFLCAALAQAPAQSRQRVYSPGEMVEVDGGEVYQIIRCEGGEWDDCEVQAYQNNRPTGNRFKISLRNIRAAEQRLLDARAPGRVGQFVRRSGGCRT